MYQANTASNVLIHIIFRCVSPYCSYYVTINDGISSPNDDRGSKTWGVYPLCISKTLSSLLNNYMNTCETVSQSYCCAKSLLNKILYASTYLSLFYLLYRIFLFFTPSPYEVTSLRPLWKEKGESRRTYNAFSNEIVVWQVR